MPQEFHVLRCYSCEIFQVQIIKKVNKWECKMCGEKQSVQKVYAKGTAKNCRLHVQELNKIRIENENSGINKHDVKVEMCKPTEMKPQVSKWSEYTTIDVKDDTLDDDEIEDERYTFERPTKRKCIRTKKQTFGIKRNEPDIASQNTNDFSYEPDVVTQNTNDQCNDPDLNDKIEKDNSRSIENVNNQHYDLNYETVRNFENVVNPKTKIINYKSVLIDNNSLNSKQLQNNLFNSELVINSQEIMNDSSICLEKNKNSSLDIKQRQHSKWAEYLNGTDTVNENSDSIKQNEISKENIFNTNNDDLDSILSF